MNNCQSLTEAIQASSVRSQQIVYIKSETAEVTVTYRQLYQNACDTLACLQSWGLKPGDQLIIAVEDNELFLNIFWACILGKIIPVPVAAAHHDEHRLKIIKIWLTLSEPYLITNQKLWDDLAGIIRTKQLAAVADSFNARVLLVHRIEKMVQPCTLYQAAPEDIALIQFSSGSTGDPKGVVLTHQNLMINIRAIIAGAQFTSNDIMLSWMPLTHDLGLIGFHLTPLVCGMNQYNMPTALFIRRPALWLAKASQHQATILASPNFGYQYLLSCFTPAEPQNWDLSPVRLIFNGAEPISEQLCNSFLDQLAQYGLKRTAMYPVYGLAEASLAVTFPPLGEEVQTVTLDRRALGIGDRVREVSREDVNSVTFVDLGYPIKDCAVRICNAAGKALDQETIGLVEIKGGNVTAGYYNNPSATAAARSGDGWLKTGDLGLLRQGRLVITGRAKEVSCINGLNYYFHDIERVAQEAAEGRIPGGIAACGIFNADEQREEIVLFVQFKKALPDFLPLAVQLKKYLSLKMGLEVTAIIPVKKIPKTTSGKLMRFKLKEMYQNGFYQPVLREIHELLDGRKAAGKPVPDADSTAAQLLAVWSELFDNQLPGVDDNLFPLVADSLQIAKFRVQIETQKIAKLSMADLFSHPSISKLAELIASRNRGDGAPETVEPERRDQAEISPNEIAIIGIGLKLPLAETVEQFWSNLRNGVDCITEFPPTRRKDIEQILRAKGREVEQLKYYEAAYLEAIDQFDHNFFKISPKEASLMEPAQRLFLETVWQAIEDAGYGGRKICGSKTGIMLGYTPNTINSYASLIFEFEHSAIQMAAVGNIPAILPSRIAYLLDLKGPTMFLDTACSSSLVAVHLACQSIRCGDCDLAIAGGVKLILIPLDDPEEKLGIESTDFRTKAFDAQSDGTGLGEGLAVVLLKPLAKALQDHDRIYAVIKGSAVNQDGYSASLTAPNPLAHADVIEAAWQKAGINPETIAYIEAHGTGTNIGDPLEVEGIARAFRRYTNKHQFCGIGTIKTNIGHLYEASGIVGLVKAALALKNREIPPTIHFNLPNPAINFEESPLYVNSKLTAWPTGEAPRRCGVHSFGLGGTNCHIVLEEAPPPAKSEARLEQGVFYVFTLSAKHWNGLNDLVKQYLDCFQRQADSELAEICYTANTGRGHYNLRLAIIARSFGELKDKLSQFKNSGNVPQIEAGIYLGEHTLVGNRIARKATELTEEAQRDLTARAAVDVEQFLATGKTNLRFLEALCQLYVKGAELDWERFYQGMKLNKLGLPTYSFARTRCWLKVPASKPQYDDTGLYYQVVWEPAEVTASAPEGIAENTLIITDALSGDTRGAATVAELRTRCNSLVQVELGTAYQKVNAQEYQIRNCEADFDKLLVELKTENIKRIIHATAWAQRPSGAALNDLTVHLEHGLYSLFYLIKAIQRVMNGKELELLILADCAAEVTGAETVLKPENVTLAALGRIFMRENPLVKCKFIDTDQQFSINQLYTELQQGFGSSQVAYRENKRYLPVFSEVNLANYQAEKPVAIKDDGVYLITGGAGGLGLAMAKYLASQNRVNIALLNRSPIPEREKWPEIIRGEAGSKLAGRLRAIEEIEANGSQVVCYSVDVADLTAMAVVIQDLKTRFQKINGIIHAAGSWSEGLTHEKSESSFAQTIRPKVQGTWILEQLTRDEEVDFLVLFSSVAAIYGAPGQGDYAAANAYLNSFASLLKKKGRRGLAINWVAWLETGMAFNTNTNISTTFKTLPTQQGVAAFATLLGSSLDQVLVGAIDYESDLVLLLEKAPLALSTKIKRNFERKKSSFAVRPKQQPGKLVGEVVLTGGADDGGFTEIEHKVAQVWGELLGYQELNVEDSFFELGGDSLQATIMVTKFYKEFNIEVPLREILSTPTIQGLAKYLQAQTETMVGVEAPSPEHRDRGGWLQ